MKKQKVVAIIQARMGSSRLPGKMLMAILDKPMLAWMIERVKMAKEVDAIVVATSNTKADDAIVQCAERCGVSVFRGSEEDVLDRYYNAAKEYSADIIVRLMGDCPLHDPQVIDESVRFFKTLCERTQYALSGSLANYPEGLDMDIFTFASLERMWDEAELPSEREHITAYMKKHPEFFELVERKIGEDDYAHLHWSVDEAGDFEFVTRVFEHFGEGMFYKNDVLKLLELQPELAELTRGRTGYEGYAKSVAKDKKKI
jgi:spore coat polysaccharide biosynthesis protein SpsF (cytidylyltransferase family)